MQASGESIKPSDEEKLLELMFEARREKKKETVKKKETMTVKLTQV